MRLAVLPFVAASLVLTACMTSPGNGQELCGDDAYVDFTGFALEPNQDIAVETAPSPNGPWEDLRRVTADEKSSLTLSTQKMYAWRASARIPKWSAASGGKKRAYVRARNNLSGGSQYAFTFDVGAEHLACVPNAIDKGKTLAEAAQMCKSDASPVARVEVPARSTCRRPWERLCKDGSRTWTPKRFFVGLKRRSDGRALLCEDIPTNLGFDVKRVVANLPSVCVFEWTRDTPMTIADAKRLEAYAELRDDWEHGRDPRNGYGLGSAAYERVPDIDPDCSTTRSTCALASCPSASAKKLPDRTKPTGFYDMTSGCPKCANVVEGQLVVVLPPEYAEMSKVSITSPYSDEVLRLSPEGRQVLVVKPKSRNGQSLNLGQVYDDTTPPADGSRLLVTPGHWYEARHEGDVPPGE